MSVFNDRLYNLLPSIVRQRDALNADPPLRSLLSVISEQVDLVEANIAQLYDDWFIETCADWAVPYIGDAIGYEVLHEAGEPSTDATAEAARLNRILIPRQDVANTVRARRRKGTLAVLAELARDVAGWPAVAVEFDRLLAVTQSLDDLRLDRGRTLDLRRRSELERLGGVGDGAARTAELRGPAGPGASGALPTSGIGLFVPRYRAYAVSGSTAAWVAHAGDHCFTFSPLENEVRLFSGVGLPLALHRSDVNAERHYGAGKSLAIARRAEGDTGAPTPVPRSAIVPADLSHWRYEPEPGTVAVDALLGRLSFPPDEVPAEVVVAYTYGFSADIGAGEYDRIPVPLPPLPLGAAIGDGKITFTGRCLGGIDVEVSVDGGAPARYRTTPTDTLASVAVAVAAAVNALAIPGVSASASDAAVLVPGVSSLGVAFPERFYPIGRNAGESHERLSAALMQWKTDGPARAVIEFADSEIYDENELDIELRAGQVLEIRAASQTRPVVRIIDWRAGAPEPLRIRGGAGSALSFDGMLIAGSGLRIGGALAHLVIRRSTLVPGWRHLSPSAKKHRVEPSILVDGAAAKISIDRSIIGPILVRRPERAPSPTPIAIADSIVDAFEHGEAIGSPDAPVADAELRVTRSTVFGRTRVHAVESAENALFCGDVTVTDRQHGYFRYCFVPPGSRTPQRFACQPDGANAVAPLFVSTRFDDPGYARLADTTPPEISRGADDRAEMGAFHDLFRAQRETNLQTRLAEYVPAGTDLAILFVS
jgi:hypothetical protein